ncbi:unnamed protein product [Trifolium pratense]|uniref:Uncharacterized protein n=1 Tax=Trifolium pratense TaxID=57577 RepID=A0ACB0IBD0_TRIPR|nr:unnamed protein product [Trifolium pratense]
MTLQLVDSKSLIPDDERHASKLARGLDIVIPDLVMQHRNDLSKKEQPNTKVLRRSRRKMNMINELADVILVYIMSFLSMRQAIQTSILSKRWKNVWKQLPNLIAKTTQFPNAANFTSFLNNFLTYRNHFDSLHNIDVDYYGFIPIHLLARLFKYGTSHNVEKITINTSGIGYHLRNFEISNIMCGRSIRYLSLSFGLTRGKVVISHNLDLPELTHCLLRNVSFSSNDKNGHLELFSSCKKLYFLIIDCCNIIGDTNLFVSNENLSKLIIRYGIDYIPMVKIQMHTPNLKSFTFAGRFGTIINRSYPLFDDNLKFLEEVNLQLWILEISREIGETLMSWLKKFGNIYSMTLTSSTVEVITYILNLSNIEDVCFRNMESLLLKIDPFAPTFYFPKEALQFLVKKSRCNEAITSCEEIPLFYEGLELKTKSGIVRMHQELDLA